MSETPKSTFTVGNASKIPAEQYGSIEVSAYASNDFPPFVDAETILAWYKEMAIAIDEVQNREEFRERMRRCLEIPARLKKYADELAEKEKQATNKTPEEVAKQAAEDLKNIGTVITESTPKPLQTQPAPPIQAPIQPAPAVKAPEAPAERLPRPNSISCKKCGKTVQPKPSTFDNGWYFKCVEDGYLDSKGYPKNKE